MPTTRSIGNGGTVKGNGYAQYDAWQKIMRFINDSIKF